MGLYSLYIHIKAPPTKFLGCILTQSKDHVQFKLRSGITNKSRREKINRSLSVETIKSRMQQTWSEGIIGYPIMDL